MWQSEWTKRIGIVQNITQIVQKKILFNLRTFNARNFTLKYHSHAYRNDVSCSWKSNKTAAEDYEAASGLIKNVSIYSPLSQSGKEKINKKVGRTEERSSDCREECYTLGKP
jgi:hypothetical protein